MFGKMFGRKKTASPKILEQRLVKKTETHEYWITRVELTQRIRPAKRGVKILEGKIE